MVKLRSESRLLAMKPVLLIVVPYFKQYSSAEYILHTGLSTRPNHTVGIFIFLFKTDIEG